MSHSFCQIFIHAVWTVKNREPLLRKEVRVELYSHITKRFKEEGIYLISLGGVEDHVHCLFQLPRDRTAAEIMKLIKADSSKW
ncbi:transposase [Cesiribacter sp. SM1]|uniref:transposase n=1 Tax=Cesiribacter sp. SM1 TaxID=2861196 RepID=UPI001CD806C2|nr:transposase [Cesiribacter sp. SM1]